MNRNIGPIVERPEQDRSRDSVVDDQRYAVVMSNLCQRLDVAYVARRIADRLGKHSLRVFIDQFFDCVRLIVVSEAADNALTRQDVGEQRVRRAVKLWNGDNVAANVRDIDEGKMQ